MLKFEGFPVGTKIRAFDFKPREEVGELFVEGVITEITNMSGADVYRVEVTKDTCFPKSPRDEAFVPMEVSMTEWDGRVTVLS